MKNQPMYRTDHQILFRMQVVHLGKILFNFQIVAFVILIASFFSLFLTAMFWLILFVIMLVTLFTIFINEDFRRLFANSSEIMDWVTSVFAQSWQYTVPTLAILSVATIICLSFDKNQKHLGRIVTSVIFGILAIGVLVIKMWGVQ